MQNRQVLGIDLLRFFAAASVCAFHLGFYQLVKPGAEGLAASPLHALLPLTGPLTRCGWVGVEIFFVISGYVIAFSAQGRDWRSYVRSRFLRLWPTVWLTATLCAGLLLLAHQQTPLTIAQHLIGSMVISPVGPWIDGVYWTLPIEIGFYLFVLAVAVGRAPERLTQLAVALGVASVAFWSVYALVINAEPGLRGPLAGFAYYRRLDIVPLHHGVFFALGMFLYRPPSRRVVALLVPPMLLAAGFEIAGEASRATEGFGAYVPAAPAILMFLVALGAMAAAVHWNAALHEALSPRSVTVVKRLGSLTYPLYLVHDVTALSAMTVAKRWGLSDWPTLGVGAVSALSIATIIALWAEPRWRRVCGHVYDAVELRLFSSRARQASPSAPDPIRQSAG